MNNYWFFTFFAEDPLGAGSFAFVMQHSKADLFLDGERDGSNGDINQANADAARPGGMAGDRFRGFFLLAGLFCCFRRLKLGHILIKER